MNLSKQSRDLILFFTKNKHINYVQQTHKTKKILTELYNMFKKYSDPGVTLTNFLTTSQSKGTKPDWIYSKYLGVKMIDILMSTTEKNRDTFTQGMVGYALSNSKDSSAFIKIY